jgi:membrane-associated phospholipid phosphatase
MSEPATYDMQLQWIRDIHEAIRSPWMDAFFRAWNYVDTLYFALLAFILVWHLWDRRIGVRLYYLFAISVVVVQSLKILFALSRPCHIDPLVAIVDCAPSFGFPSGGAQSGVIYAGIVFLETKRVLYRFLAVIFACFVCFSRIYLGMHYVTDVLGGIVLGCLLLIVYKKVFPLFEKRWDIAAVIFPFALLLSVYLCSLSMSWGFNFCLLSLGVACGLLSYAKTAKEPKIPMAIRIWQTISVLAGTVGLFVLRRYFSDLNLLWSFIQGYWLSFLGAYIVKRG